MESRYPKKIGISDLTNVDEPYLENKHYGKNFMTATIRNS